MVALVVATTLTAFAAKTSVNADLADGAAIAAACRLGQDKEGAAGRQLLAFALAIDPENERALLLQAKLERGEELERTELADGGRQFIDFVEGIAVKTKPRARSLLLYRVIELIDPQHQKARLELTRAQNQGMDTDFEALLRSVRPKEAAHPEGEGKGADGARRDVFKELANLTFPASGFQGYQLYDDPLRFVNQLNHQLRPGKPSIRVNSKTRAVGIYGEGDEFHSEAFHSRSFRSPGYSGSAAEPLAGMNGRSVLLILCALHDLGWQQQDDGLTLVDSADASGPAAGALTDAQSLASQAKKSQVDMLKTYRGKELIVSGLASGLGKSSPRYIHLANDQVRIYFGSGKAAEESLRELAEDYDRVTKVEREARDGDYPSLPRALLFIGAARFDGITGGRVTLKGCSDFTFLRTNLSRRD
jgi:hypothetical protein